MERDPGVAPATLFGRRRYAGLWFGLAMFGTAFGLAMALGGAWAGWFFVITLGPCAVVLGLNLRPQSNMLRLDGSGYALVSLFRTAEVPWSDVEKIGVIDGHKEPVVAIRFAPTAAARIADSAEIAQAMGGYHRTLPLTYGMSAPDLAALMLRYRAG